ncbi:MAG: ABC transporter ATP-binding protein [Betaproteobacteria bacterium RIFCSPLOWO2_12_FULL_65_14]|nr:MAG: ABC transporter ATP-binding protein [Betaproteobacteria bacterium RIFCSPLOWO2_12_FULL_65_14]
MRFAWPEALLLLVAVPALVALYLRLLRRQKRAAVRFASLDLVREAIGGARLWRRHVPPAVFLAALAVAILAIARPNAVLTLPTHQRTVILAIDVSISMRATDVEPNRLAAAQSAAKAFVRDQPTDLRIGIVSFAGTAAVVQKPTQNRDDLIAAVDRLELDRHTAIGSGIIMSLATLFPEEGIDLESLVLGSRESWRMHRPPPKKAEKKPVQAVAPGSNTSSAIVLLTDGRRTTGPDPLDAARMAAERGIRVFTVGFGSASGGPAMIEGYSIYMMFDEETLKAIASLTGADYFHAASADELKKIYESLTSRFVMEREEREVSALFSAVAALLALAAGGLSLAWFNRIV